MERFPLILHLCTIWRWSVSLAKQSLEVAPEPVIHETGQAPEMAWTCWRMEEFQLLTGMNYRSSSAQRVTLLIELFHKAVNSWRGCYHVKHCFVKYLYKFVPLKAGIAQIRVWTGRSQFDSRKRQEIFSFPYCPDHIYCPLASYPMGTGGTFPEGKVSGAWSWPLTCIWRRGHTGIMKCYKLKCDRQGMNVGRLVATHRTNWLQEQEGSEKKGHDILPWTVNMKCISQEKENIVIRGSEL
jgi:hypothetical protein